MKEKVWKTNIRVEAPFTELVLTPIDSILPWNAYYRIEFTSDNNFRVYNIPGCGMDCVVSSYGSYRYSNEMIQLTIDSTFRYRQCSGDSVLFNALGSYHIVNDAYGIRLLKSLKDEPKANYFKALGIEVPLFAAQEANELFQRYIYLYNRLSQIVENKNVERFSQLNNEIHVWSTKSWVYSYSIINEERISYSKFHVDLDKRIRALLLELRQ